MPTRIQLYDREIAPKGKCYLVILEYDADDFENVLTDMISFCFQSGARAVHVASRCQEQPISDGTSIYDFVFRYDTDFDFYEKELLPDESPKAQPLRLKRLNRSNAPLYQAIFNETFFSVPNSQTLDETELSDLLNNDQRQGGFFMIGGAPVGVYEISFSDETPEIASIAILSACQNKGYARTGLRLLEEQLRTSGHKRVQLLAASRNTRAVEVYQSCGYQKTRHLSTWFVTHRPE